MKHDKSNTAFVHEVVIIFSLIFFYQRPLMWLAHSTKDRVIKVNSGCKYYTNL